MSEDFTSRVHDNQINNIQEALIQIDSEYRLEIITNPESPLIVEVAALDKELFGPHKSLSAEGFARIVENGGVLFTHMDSEGAVISEASLVLNPGVSAETSLERNLPGWLGYCDGAAVSKEYRGKGLQKRLLQAREIASKEVGKDATGASVRHRNLASIRSMLKEGYVMIADAPQYYGDAPEDSRVFMLKEFSAGNPLNALNSDEDGLEDALKGTALLSEVPSKIECKQDVISLAVEQSDEVDSTYNAAVGQLLSNGYIGVACKDIDIADSDSERSSAMVFLRLESLPEDTRKTYELRQNELNAVLAY